MDPISETSQQKQTRALRIIEELAKTYQPVCGLHYRNPFELLIATLLSAQCTDERVNQITPALFQRYPNAATMAQVSVEEIEALIRSTGLYRTKAKHIRELCAQLLATHNGEVPTCMAALTALPGVGRKTAHVVLGTAFGQPALPVDTHVKRVARRLALTAASDPAPIEKDLAALIPPAAQTAFSHRLIWHGRRVCHAKKPACADCVLARLCPHPR
jgi:endonuclease-3